MADTETKDVIDRIEKKVTGIFYKNTRLNENNVELIKEVIQLKEKIEDLEKVIQSIRDIPYHTEGMGCGLEDMNITDRYEAMAHGWDNAMEAVIELLPEVS